jgi:RNA recognition motif-containing protein
MDEKKKLVEKQAKEETASSSAPSGNLLDETWYYYQNPTSGSVSTTPLTLRQLCRLFCPVREGLKPILPPHTRCLTYVGSNQQFGEWKLASDLDVLREASAQWFGATSGGTSEGPFSCRKIIKDKSPMVYSKGITPQWIAAEKLSNLQLVMQALENPTPVTQPSIASNDNTQQQKDDSQQVNDELEDFLSSTAEDVRENKHKMQNNAAPDQNDVSYESDGGTKYVKDPLTGNWIHEALAPQETIADSSASATNNIVTTANVKTVSKKNKKSKFSRRNAKHWVYVTGLPTTTGITVDDIQRYFSKAGLLDLDPETLKPKIKLYRTKEGQLKGDASICYARPESVNLALQILDESPWDTHHTIRVEQAKFIAKEGTENTIGNKRRKPISEAKRKVARLALLQAQDEGFGVRLAGGRKGLRIIVVKYMMDEIPENRLEDEIHDLCKEHGQVEKITCIEKTKVVIIKFSEPTAASNAIEAWHGKRNERTKQKIEAIYWDGVTDYTHKENDGEEDVRHEEFGKWLESQEELPPELRLKIAKD